MKHLNDSFIFILLGSSPQLTNLSLMQYKLYIIDVIGTGSGHINLSTCISVNCHVGKEKLKSTVRYPYENFMLSFSIIFHVDMYKLNNNLFQFTQIGSNYTG